MATPVNILKEMGSDIRQIDRTVEAKRLVAKWERTGLLEGLKDLPNSKRKSNMAVLLENQAGFLLNEASTVSDITGFQNVAFPIVRRVFAGLIANELVSVQPMSLPSGLLFYLDYRFDVVKGGDQLDRASNFAALGSLFGDQTAPGTQNLGTGGFYNLGSSFSQREKISTGTFTYVATSATYANVFFDPDLTVPYQSATALVSGFFIIEVSGVFKSGTSIPSFADGANALVGQNQLKQWVLVSTSSLSAPQAPIVSGTFGLTGSDGVPVQQADWVVYRRFTVQGFNTTASFGSGSSLLFIVSSSQLASQTWTTGSGPSGSIKLDFIVGAQLNQVQDVNGNAAGTLTLDAFESDMGVAPTPPIPELDFTIKSVAVTANSRKLKARWTPELAQDLAAYQNLDAEVELTQVLSEAIALEIDREILGDLLYNATGANFWWSRIPGRFVNKTSGSIVAGPTFTGTVREWYETLIETCIDVANNIHRKTLRGAANFMVTSPDVATILEASVLYKPVLSMDPKETMFTVGTEKVGTLNNRFTVYKDPYFPRNRILMGYKGGSFLETGYVYAPYVPLIVTPTIYAPEDFTPRKGVMTRYAKQLVRSDFYGTVTVMDLNVI
jgi:Major capsid protein Gp23